MFSSFGVEAMPSSYIITPVLRLPAVLLWILALLLVLPPVGHDAFGESESRTESDAKRYFAVWSYAENAPTQEIPAGEIAGRELGYWELAFDAQGSVLGGTYHGASGAVWLSLRYVEVDGRIYADLYGPTGTLITRKSTRLRDRAPQSRP